MKRFLRVKALSFFLAITFSIALYSAHAIETPVTTSYGLVGIEKVSLDSHVIGFNDQAQTSLEALIESNVHELHRVAYNKFYGISLVKDTLFVSPDQKFYDLITQDWVEAEKLNHKSILIDIYGNYHQCLAVTLYNYPCKMYDISIDSPHFYFTGKAQILTHNALPVLLLYVPSTVLIKKAAFSTAIGAATLWSIFNSKSTNKHRKSISPTIAQQPSCFPTPPSDQDPDKNSQKKDCKYKDATQPRSRYSNTETNLTQKEFEETLKQNGWKHTKSSDGKIDNYEKDNARYAVRSFSKSTNGPTADYYKPGSMSIDAKIRLLKG